MKENIGFLSRTLKLRIMEIKHSDNLTPNLTSNPHYVNTLNNELTANEQGFTPGPMRKLAEQELILYKNLKTLGKDNKSVRRPVRGIDYKHYTHRQLLSYYGEENKQKGKSLFTK